MHFDIAVHKHAVKLPEQLRGEIAYFQHQRTVTTSEARRAGYWLAIRIREAALVEALARVAAVAGRQDP